jgi:uncharacterized protein involved in outer membrane biogenesis
MRPLKATIGGGVAEVQGICRAEGNNVAVSAKIRIDELELNHLLKELQTDNVVDAVVGGELEFSTFGNSVRSLMANLNGKAIVSVGRGRIKNDLVRLFGADLNTGLWGLFGSSKSRGDYTALDCAVCALDVKEGLARVIALVVDTPETTVHGAGEVDLKTERLDLSLEPLPKRGVAGLSLSLGELAKPFKLSGTLADPSLTIDPTKTALTIGKAVAGVLFFGPLGIAGALTGKTSGENPCAAALEAARKGSKPVETGRVGESVTLRDPRENDARGGH